jgi:hypothetical protein
MSTPADVGEEEDSYREQCTCVLVCVAIVHVAVVDKELMGFSLLTLEQGTTSC